MKSWAAAVAGEPEAVEPAEVPCRLCGIGVAVYCALCWPDAVMAYRQGVAAAQQPSEGEPAGGVWQP